MAKARVPATQRRFDGPAGFLGQGLLILLPVVVLSVLGLMSLQQDRRLAELEAAERAQSLADTLMERLWNEVTTLPADFPHAFKVNAQGELVFPPALPAVPTPQPFKLDDLNGEQAQAWRKLQTFSPNADLDNERRAAEAFLKLSPSTRFATAAQFRLAQALARQGAHDQAAEQFRVLAEQSPEIYGESGLPWQPLAQLKWLELLAQRGGSTDASGVFESLCSNAVHRPTLLTPELLRQVSQLAEPLQLQERARHWTTTWQRHEYARALYRAWVARGQDFASTPTEMNTNLPPRLAWFHSEELPGELLAGETESNALANHQPLTIDQFMPWLAARVDGNDGTWMACWPVLETRAKPTPTENPTKTTIDGSQSMPLPVTRLMEYAAGRLPPYFGIGVSLMGSNLVAVPSPQIRLAFAKKLEQGTEWASVSVYFTDPTQFYVRQRQRASWFCALIGVSAVTAFLGWVAIRRALRKQQRLAEMKTDFVSSVSHELRAPIAAVRLLGESLERGKIQEPGKQREYYRFIVQECRRLSSLVENVLDFARIEQGRKAYEFEPADITKLVEQTRNLIEPYAAERGIRLASNLDQQPLSEKTREPVLDGRAIQQALVNLIDNAIKHSPSGSVVTIGLHYTPAPGSAATTDCPFKISVNDQGPGIPPEEHEKIFERFYRRGSELRRETQGVGIGLSIVKHIVEAHGGRITVESAVGLGSTFTLHLPSEPPTLRTTKP